MYFDKYITEDMTYEDAERVKDELVSKILFDVPEEYNIDSTYFDRYLNRYCNEKGIQKNNLTL